MEKLSIFQTIIFSIPESMIIILLTYCLLDVKVDGLKIIKISILMGILSYFIRFFAYNYVVNVIVFVGTLVIILSILKINSLFERIIAVIMATSIYLIVEFLNVKILQMIFNFTPILLLDNFLLRFLCFIPQMLANLFIIFILNDFSFSIFTNQSRNLN